MFRQRCHILGAALTLLSVTLVAGPAHAAPAGTWVGTWSASVQQPRPAELSTPGSLDQKGFTDQTLRQIVRTSAGGSAIRLHLSNKYGSGTLEVGTTTVGLQQADATLAGAPVPVTFHGQPGVSIPAGGQAVSDPVPLAVAPLTALSVSIHLPVATGPATNHSFADQVNYVSGPGDFATATDGAAFARSFGHWYFLSGVDVRAGGRAAYSVVAFGDDSTDGFLSTPNADARWTDDLAVRLQQQGRPVGVLNAGINGNRLLSGSPCFGTAAVDRFRDDALRQTGVRAVILHEGINDAGFSLVPATGCSLPSRSVTAGDIIEGYQKIIAMAHAHGVRVIGGTLTPIAGSGYASPDNEQIRAAVNDWIRRSRQFDAVADFDAAVRDPADPSVLLAAYDAGDHLHLNDDGFRAMAAAVPLSSCL